MFLTVLYSCVDNETKLVTNDRPTHNKGINDSVWVKDYSFKKGDIRRYGLQPNQPIFKRKLDILLELGEKGLILNFPKGYYNSDLIFAGNKNITMYFDDATFGGSVEVIENNQENSRNIQFKGKLTVLDKVFIRKAKNISFDSLTIKSDTIRNLHHKLNRGLSIYVGSKNIQFNNLKIINTGGGQNKFYKHTAAALQIHGWNNNPEKVIIDNLLVENASRTAVYLTGNNHRINKASIKNYGLKTSTKNIFGLDDAKPGSEKLFSGFWINKCNDCYIDSLEVSNIAKADYSLKFGIGEYSHPAVINNLKLSKEAKREPIDDDMLTNVLVKNEY
jgi:hypothetical protein